MATHSAPPPAAAQAPHSAEAAATAAAFDAQRWSAAQCQLPARATSAAGDVGARLHERRTALTDVSNAQLLRAPGGKPAALLLPGADVRAAAPSGAHAAARGSAEPCEPPQHSEHAPFRVPKRAPEPPEQQQAVETVRAHQVPLLELLQQLLSLPPASAANVLATLQAAAAAAQSPQPLRRPTDPRRPADALLPLALLIAPGYGAAAAGVQAPVRQAPPHAASRTAGVAALSVRPVAGAAGAAAMPRHAAGAPADTQRLVAAMQHPRAAAFAELDRRGSSRWDHHCNRGQACNRSRSRSRSPPREQRRWRSRSRSPERCYRRGSSRSSSGAEPGSCCSPQYSSAGQLAAAAPAAPPVAAATAPVTFAADAVWLYNTPKRGVQGPFSPATLASFRAALVRKKRWKTLRVWRLGQAEAEAVLLCELLP